MRRALQSIRWYLRELTGESQYDRYLARHAEHAEPEGARGHRSAVAQGVRAGPPGPDPDRPREPLLLSPG